VIEVEGHSISIEGRLIRVFEPSIENGGSFTEHASPFAEETFSFQEVDASSIAAEGSMVEVKERVVEEEASIVSIAFPVIGVEGPLIEVLRRVSSTKPPSASIDWSSRSLERPFASVTRPSISIECFRVSIIVSSISIDDSITSIARPFASIVRPRASIEAPCCLHEGLSREGNAPRAHEKRPRFFINVTFHGIEEKPRHLDQHRADQHASFDRRARPSWPHACAGSSAVMSSLDDAGGERRRRV
jgi:hypothetical protein